MTNVHKAKLLKILPKMTRINAHECANKFREEYGKR